MGNGPKDRAVVKGDDPASLRKAAKDLEREAKSFLKDWETGYKDSAEKESNSIIPRFIRSHF